MNIYSVTPTEKQIQRFKPTTLYIKQHNTTGLKYFGKTIKNPYTYNGSGIHWTRHLNKHGNDVTTIVLGHYTDINLLVNTSIQFSIDNNIVESKEWANMKIEDGLMGGAMSAKSQKIANKKRTGLKRTEEQKKNMSVWQKGIPKGLCTEDRREKVRKSNTGKVRTDEQKRRYSESNLKRPMITCPHCGLNSRTRTNMNRYHFNNCKRKT